MDNYPISIFLIDARNKTLPILKLKYPEENPDPTIAAVSSGLILRTIVVLLVADRLVGLRRLAEFSGPARRPSGPAPGCAVPPAVLSGLDRWSIVMSHRRGNAGMAILQSHALA